MTDRGVIFSAPMVQAQLEDRKTMTRRFAWGPRFSFEVPAKDAALWKWGHWTPGTCAWPSAKQLAKMGVIPGTDVLTGYMRRSAWQDVAVGDRLYVRESWRVSERQNGVKPRDLKARSMSVMFEAGGSIANDAEGWVPDTSWPLVGERIDWAGILRPAIFLPRWASRLTGIVTAAKVEPLRVITADDIRSEGLVAATTLKTGPGADEDLQSQWFELWERIHGEGTYAANPDVVAVTFRVHLGNIDCMKVAA